MAAAALAYSYLLFSLLQPQLNPDVPEGLQGSALLDRGALSLAGIVMLAGPALGEELIFRLGIQGWLVGLVPRIRLAPRWEWAALLLTALCWTLRRFARTLLLAKRAAREEMDRRGDGFLAGPAWIPRSFLKAYWRNLSYDLAAEQDGLRLFFRLAAKIGRIPAAPPLRFLDLD